jgi:hypothetical protein
MTEIIAPQPDQPDLSASLASTPVAAEQLRTIPKDAYHLSPEVLDSMEVTITQTVSEKSRLTTGIAVLMVDGQHELGDFGRTYEQQIFAGEGEDYDFHEGMQPYEDRSTFIYTVDLDMGRVAHVKRVVNALSPEASEQSGITGLEVLDDRVRAVVPEEHATVEEIKAFHQVEDFQRCLNITTNLNTKRGERNFFEKPYSLISYKAVFSLVERDDLSHLFAYMNPKAITSLQGGLGVDHELLNGKEYHLPLPHDPTQFDDNYLAVAIPVTQPNKDAFTKKNDQFMGTHLIAEREVVVSYV